MSSSSISAGGRSDYLEQLAAIREDPKVKKLARGRAGDPELAEDALQEAYYAVARLEDLEHIEDLRAYYCRVLLRTIHKLRGQLGADLIEDFEVVADNRQRKPGGELPPLPLDEMVASHLLIQDLLKYFARHGADLSRAVSARSPDPAHYRDMIATIAERLLLASDAGGLSEAEQNQALRTLYPEWFDEAVAAVNNVHQRFTRARADVDRLLQGFIKRGDLYS
ncbi:MAG TPA: hypothetical protein VMA73_18150 [Streptosporangiaceae bacterium]|nr:hypothetical protein [Streptosporangiaceae bacterium]